MAQPKITLKNNNFLFLATGGILALAFVASMNFLFQATLPSVDVVSDTRPSTYSLNVEGIKPGEAATFTYKKVPVVVWRRDFQQKVKALEVLGVDFISNARLLEEVRTKSEIALGADRVLQFEWFVVSPINTGGYGCLVLANAGDLGGFFDPCQDVHFDLWGQVAKGPTESDLHVLPWRLSDDGKSIVVDTSDAPRLK